MSDKVRPIISLLSFVGFWLPFLLTPFAVLLGWGGCVIWSFFCFIAMCAVAGDSGDSSK